MCECTFVWSKPTFWIINFNVFSLSTNAMHSIHIIKYRMHSTPLHSIDHFRAYRFNVRAAELRLTAYIAWFVYLLSFTMVKSYSIVHTYVRYIANEIANHFHSVRSFDDNIYYYTFARGLFVLWYFFPVYARLHCLMMWIILQFNSSSSILLSV